VRSPTWWIAFVLTLLTAATFIIPMVTFFRARRGSVPTRAVLFASIVGGLGAILAVLDRHTTVDVTALAFGSVLCAIGHVLFLTAARAHRVNRPSGAFAADAPTLLALGGPYRLIRHPFYTAYVLEFAAAAAFTESPLVWLVPAWMSGLYTLAARQEERLILRSPLGPTYRRYREQVGMFVPTRRAMSLTVANSVRWWAHVVGALSSHPRKHRADYPENQIDETGRCVRSTSRSSVAAP
jgi:protein-S-isoprenylcysteine O-methyltransferase Ste14